MEGGGGPGYTHASSASGDEPEVKREREIGEAKTEMLYKAVTSKNNFF